MSDSYTDPDTGATLTPPQLAAEQRDCRARATELASELTSCLRRAAQLRMDLRAEVFPIDETKSVLDRTPLPKNVVSRFPRREPGPRYQLVAVLGPETEVIYPNDPRHPDHPDHKR
jgi:hypothetical protein